jgi:hypothetical protein
MGGKLGRVTIRVASAGTSISNFPFGMVLPRQPSVENDNPGVGKQSLPEK